MLKGRKPKRLSPCPFCGGHAEIYSSYDNPDIFQAKCEDCYARSGWFHSAEEAAEHWNARPDYAA